MYRTTDGGRTWESLADGLPAPFAKYVDAVDVDPSDPSHVALATSAGEVFESHDGGASWARTAQAPPVRRLLAVE